MHAPPPLPQLEVVPRRELFVLRVGSNHESHIYYLKFDLILVSDIIMASGFGRKVLARVLLSVAEPEPIFFLVRAGSRSLLF